MMKILPVNISLRKEVPYRGGTVSKGSFKEAVTAVVDVPLPAGVDLANLATALDEMPGVVGHGLFLTEADFA
jgi:ribose 5-phosphate isomerase